MAASSKLPETSTEAAAQAEISYLATMSQAIPVMELLAAGPRAARFLARSTTRNLRFPGAMSHPNIPTRTPSMGTAFGVWLDELMLAFMATTRLNPTDDDLDRISEEVTTAIAALDAAGAFKDPTVAHRKPTGAPKMTSESASYRGIPYQHVTYESGYDPTIELPGATRWQSHAANQVAHAYVLRHDEPRPWLVQLHGFGMGKPTDLIAMRSLHFHRDLGFNVIHPVFPSHGPRSSGVSGEEVLTLDYLNNVHAVSQAVWDVRQLLDWAREDDRPIAIHGVSMGGYLAALLAGLAPDLHSVITGVPTVDMAWVMQRHTPDEERIALDERSLLGERAQKIHSVISPLDFTPNVPVERRFIYAGVADRMATPGQAYRLWTHWDEPSVLWYRGAHVSFAWSREVRRFVDRSLREIGGSPAVHAHSSSNQGDSA